MRWRFPVSYTHLLEKLNEIVFFENRFDVIGKLRDPDDVFEILPKLQGCQAVIVSGIDATLRNGIVKACICLLYTSKSFRLPTWRQR